MGAGPGDHDDADDILERLGRFYTESPRAERDAATPGNRAGSPDVTPESEPDERVRAGSWRKLRIVRRIGSGSQGDVYEAFDPLLGRPVALKLIRKQLTSEDSAEARAARALDEARKLARVNCDRVVQIFWIEETREEIGLCLQYLQGETLETALRSRGQFGDHEVVAIGLELCKALAAVHRAKIVHGDVKAANVMRESSSGRIVLMDFGISRRIDRGDGSSSVGFAGSPLSMAPETLRHGLLTPASDIYSLGVLLYRLTSGHFPIEANTHRRLLEAHDSGLRRRLRDDAPGAGEELVEVIERALSPDPKHRFRTVGEMQRALARTQRGAERFPLRRLLVPGLLVALGLGGYASKDFFLSRLLPYDIDVSFHRSLDEGNDREPVPYGTPLAVGDDLFMEVRASARLWLYVIATDRTGTITALFPFDMRGVDGSNPIAANAAVCIPGLDEKQKVVTWEVTGSGEEETILVVASPVRLPSLESELDELRRPTRSSERGEEGRNRAEDLLRGVGALKSSNIPGPAVKPQVVGKWLEGVDSLTSGVSRARGVWIRQARFGHAR